MVKEVLPGSAVIGGTIDFTRLATGSSRQAGVDLYVRETEVSKKAILCVRRKLGPQVVAEALALVLAGGSQRR